MKRFRELRWPLFDQAMVSATNFLIGVLLVRLSGVESYGVYVLLWAVVQFTQSFQNALLIAPMQTIGPALATDSQDAYFKSMARWLVVFAAASGVLTLALTSGLQGFLPEFWQKEYSMGLAAWVVSMQLQDGIRRWQFTRSNSRRAFITDFIAYPGQIIVILWMGIAGLGLEYMLFGFSALLLISAFVGGLVEAVVKGAPGQSLNNAWRINWPASKWLVGTALLQWLSGNYILMSAAVIMGPAISGAIRAAQNLLAITHVLFQGLENIVPARAAKEYAQGGWHAMTAYTKRVGVGLLLATGGVALIAFMFSREILMITYGTAPAESITAAAWYVPIYVLMAAALPSRTTLRVIEKTQSIFVGYLLSAIVSVGLSKTAPAWFGVNGVMAIILIGFILIITPQYITILRHKKVNRPKN